jgi:arylsulfatase A-like enzyme
MPADTRRNFAKTLAASAAGLPQAARRDSRPNIVIFYVDELRASALKLFGDGGLEMPNLERLARRGIVYQNAITPHPLCVPARVSLWTGQYTSSHGSRYNQRLLPDDRASMADILKRSGYRLGIFGKNHCFTGGQLTRWFDADYSLGSDAWKRSLSPALAASVRQHQQWIRAQGGGTMPPMAAPFPPEIFETRLINERAMQFVEAQPGQPFLAWISIPDPHHPVQTPEAYSRRVPPETIKLPPYRPGELKTKITRMQIYDYLVRGPELPEAFLREFLRIYCAMTIFIDDELGRLMNLLDRRGLTGNTIVLFTSDHGDFAAEHHLIIKTGSLLDSMVRIPLVVSWPGKIREGSREEAPVSHIDLMPTLLGLCGLATPESVQGRRLPLRGPDERRAFAYSEYGNGDPMYTWEEARAIGPATRVGDYTLNTPVLMEHLARRERAGHLRMIRTNAHKLIVDSNGEREFYDLRRDPHELANLQGQPAYRAAETALQKLLDAGRF